MKKKKNFHLILAILLIDVFCNTAYSQSRWEYVGYSTDGIGNYTKYWYYDTETISYSTNYKEVTFWAKVIWYYPNLDSYSDNPDLKLVDYQLQIITVYCDTRKIKFGGTTHYYYHFRRGTETFEEKIQINDIVPDTIGEEIFRVLCE